MPNNRIISRLADCRLGGYPDEDYETELTEEARGESYDEEKENDKIARMETCLNDIVGGDYSITDVNKNDIYHKQQQQNTAQNEQPQQQPQQPQQTEQEHFIYPHHHRRPARYARHDEENYESPIYEEARAANRSIFRPVKMQRMPYIEADDMERINSNRYIPQKSTLAIIIICVVFVITLVIIISSFYCYNNKLTNKIASLEKIINMRTHEPQPQPLIYQQGSYLSQPAPQQEQQTPYYAMSPQVFHKPPLNPNYVNNQK